MTDPREVLAALESATERVRGLVFRLEKVTVERDAAIRLRAEWCATIQEHGSSSDHWDRHYAQAVHYQGRCADCSIRQSRGAQGTRLVELLAAGARQLIEQHDYDG
jgi:hypothetical protein